MDSYMDQFCSLSKIELCLKKLKHSSSSKLNSTYPGQTEQQPTLRIELNPQKHVSVNLGIAFVIKLGSLEIILPRNTKITE